MFRRIGVLATFMAGALLAGCASTGRLRTFSDFKYPAGDSTRIYLLADCLVLDNIEGPRHALDVTFNERTCNDFARAVAVRLQDDSKLPVTVKAVTLGLLTGSGRFVRTTDEKTGRVNLPVYVSETRLSPDEQRIFASVSKRLNDSVYGWKQRRNYVESLEDSRFPIIRETGLGDDALIMMAFLDGMRMRGSATVGQGNLSALFTLGSGGGGQRSMTSAKAILLRSDGTPVWADATFSHDPMDSGSQVSSLAHTLLRYFPFRVAGSGSTGQRDAGTTSTD